MGNVSVRDPKTGGWLRSDVAGMIDGPNTYLYSGANPTQLGDPLGLCLSVLFAQGAVELIDDAVLTNVGRAVEYSDDADLAATFMLIAASLLPWVVVAHANALRGDLHHIATNKHTTRWTPEFQKLFENGGLKLSSKENLVRVVGHAGPHNEVYHTIVYTTLVKYIGKAKPHTPEYAKRLSRGLAYLRKELETKGSELWHLVQK
jgi:hypothetical protein